MSSAAPLYLNNSAHHPVASKQVIKLAGWIRLRRFSVRVQDYCTLLVFMCIFDTHDSCSCAGSLHVTFVMCRAVQPERVRHRLQPCLLLICCGHSEWCSVSNLPLHTFVHAGSVKGSYREDCVCVFVCVCVCVCVCDLDYICGQRISHLSSLLCFFAFIVVTLFAVFV